MAHAGASNTHTNTRVDEKPHMCCTHVKNKKQEIPGGVKKQSWNGILIVLLTWIWI